MTAVPGKRRLFRLVGRTNLDEDTTTELGLHLDLLTDELIAGGMDPVAATAEARRRFGDPTTVHREVLRIDRQKERDMRRTEWIDAGLADLKQAFRGLRHNPGFTLATILTLGAGIGLTTAVFSVFDAVLLRPFPFQQSGRLFRAWSTNSARDLRFFSVSWADLNDWRSARSVSALAAYDRQRDLVLTGGADPERIQGAQVSPETFPLLGVRPALGRGFLTEEGHPGNAARTVVLSYGLWQRRFGGDSGVLNRTIRLNDEPWIVVGVMPRGFILPGNPAELWTPLAPGPGSEDRGNRFLRVVGRLAPGASLQTASDELNLIAARVAREFPSSTGTWSVTLLGMTDAMLGEDFHAAVRVLLGAVLLVLLIACSNVATMVLGRATARRRELAVRTALGAGRRRLARLLATESLLLGLGSSVLGIALAAGLVRLLLGFQPAGLPRLDQTRVNQTALLVAIGLGIVIGLGFGLFPLSRVSGDGLPARLRDGGRGETGSRSRHRSQRVLVVAETALAVLLLSGAGLLIRSFVQLQQVELGFEPHGVSAVTLTLPETRYPSAARIIGFQEQLTERIRAIPGVEAIAAINSVPLSGANQAYSFGVVGRPLPAAGEVPDADFRSVTPGYFRLMGIPLLAGRDFTAQDDSAGSGVVILSATTAERYWPGENPIGSRIRIGDAAEGPEALVVGVVGDVRHMSLEREHRPLIYASALRTAPRSLSLMVKSAGTPLSSEAVRRVVLSLDQAQPVSAIRTMDEIVEEVMAGNRFNVIVLGIFALAALGLAAIGLYGVMAYAVVQRTRELGLRLALGADARRVLRMILGESLTLAASGVLLGVAGALILNRLLATLLFGVEPNDPFALVLAAAILLGGGVLGGLMPARRAAALDPMETLRSD